MESMDGCIEIMDGWMDRINGKMDRVNGCMNGINGWMQRLNRWMYGWNQWMCGYIEKMDGWIESINGKRNTNIYNKFLQTNLTCNCSTSLWNELGNPLKLVKQENCVLCNISGLIFWINVEIERRRPKTPSFSK